MQARSLYYFQIQAMVFTRAWYVQNEEDFSHTSGERECSTFIDYSLRIYQGLLALLRTAKAAIKDSI